MRNCRPNNELLRVVLVLALVWMLRAYGLRRTAMTASLMAASPAAVMERSSPRLTKGAVPYGVALATGVLVAAWFPTTLSRVIHAAF